MYDASNYALQSQNLAAANSLALNVATSNAGALGYSQGASDATLSAATAMNQMHSQHQQETARREIENSLLSASQSASLSRQRQHPEPQPNPPMVTSPNTWQLTPASSSSYVPTGGLGAIYASATMTSRGSRGLVPSPSIVD